MTQSEFVARLRTEVEQWRRERLIDDDQAASILSRYGGAAGRPLNRLAVVLAFLGAVLIGVGVILFFASNWAFIPGGAKLASVLFALAASYHAGYRLRYAGDAYPGTGNALLFLGTLLYGAGIFLVAQGYHVNANAPSLLVLWAAGVLPMAYRLTSRPMVALALLLLGIALVWETVFWVDRLDFGITGFFAVLLLFGVLLYALGGVQATCPGGEPYRRPYSLLGLFLLLATLMPLTFFDLWKAFDLWAGWGGRAFREPAWELLAPGGQLRFAALGGAAGAALAVWFLRSRADRLARQEARGLAAMLAAAIGLWFYAGGAPLAMTLLANLLLLGLAVGALGVGYTRREPAWVNLALLFFAVQAGSRYVDLFWQKLPGEIFFLAAGALLLGGGIALERTRRRLLREIQEGEDG